MLAVAYVLRLEDLAAQVHAHTVAAGIAAALGVQQTGGDLAHWESAKAAFDADLAAPPPGQQPTDRSLRGLRLRALGVA